MDPVTLKTGIMAAEITADDSVCVACQNFLLYQNNMTYFE